MRYAHLGVVRGWLLFHFKFGSILFLYAGDKENGKDSFLQFVSLFIFIQNRNTNLLSIMEYLNAFFQMLQSPMAKT